MLRNILGFNHYSMQSNHSCSHSSDKFVLRVKHVPGILVGLGNAAVNKIDTILHLYGSCTLVGEKQAIKQIGMSLRVCNHYGEE